MAILVLSPLPSHGSFQGAHQGHNRRKCKHRFHETEPQPNQAAIPHLERVMGRWQETRPNFHLEIAVEVALCHKAKLPSDRTINCEGDRGFC